MYAIVDIAGQQFKVEKKQKLFVHRLADNEGSKVQFDSVLLIDNDKDVVVGAPTIAGAAVSATVVSHMKGDKVIVFKKKRRKGYKVKNGHRQYMSEIVIDDIIEKGATAKPAADKKPAAPKAEMKEAPKAEAKATPKAETKTEAKKPAAKTTTKAADEKKPAAKKPAAKKPAAKATTKTAAEKKPAAKKPAAKKPAAKKDDKE